MLMLTGMVTAVMSSAFCWSSFLFQSSFMVGFPFK
jgi:hypothetical protein